MAWCGFHGEHCNITVTRGDSINGDFYLSGPLIEDKLGLQLYGSSYLRAEDKIMYGQGRNDNKNITAKLAFYSYR